MDDITENEEKDEIFWENKRAVKMNQNEGNGNEAIISNTNFIPSNRSSKATTKISKFTYDPQNQSTRAIIKSTHTYGNNLPSDQIKQPLFFNEPARLDDEKLKTSKFKIRDINKFSEKKLTDSPDNANPINKNNDFLKKKLEREKDIEDIQNMLNQINTSCHENKDEYQNSLKIVNSTNTPLEDNLKFNKIETSQILHNELEIKIPVNVEKESNFDIISTEKTVDVHFNKNQNILNQVTELNPQKVQKNIKKSDQLNSSSETDLNLRRSQTDINLKTKFLLSPQKPISSRTTTIRSKSTTNLLSRDSSKVTLETATKKKSYDPNEARRFMKEQRIKRQQNKKEQIGLLPKNKSNISSNIDKEAIKKRLEELRKNTLKILEKNVKIKEKQTKKIENHTDVNLTSNPNSIRSNKTILKQLNSKGTLKLEKTKKRIGNNENIINKKVGLLRKPETEENSFSVLKDFNINKENLNFNMKTPTVTETSENDKGFRKISDTVMFKKVPESIFNLPKNSKSSNPNLAEIEINKQENNLDLKIPNKKLERKVSLREKSIQVDPQPSITVKNSKSNELPYWLKPTPVQYYPYNFIMAVRKKLEAITNPVITDNIKYEKHVRKNHNEIKKTQETPLTYPKDRKEPARRRIIDEKNFNSNINDSSDKNINLNMQKEVNVPNEKSEKIKNDNYGQSISEITSNFSSISIHVPESHTISDYSSIRSDAACNKKSFKHIINSTKTSDHRNNKIVNKLNFIHEDDTTISSSIFSSPEKIVKKKTEELNIDIELGAGLLSPLSVDNINKLKIKSKCNFEKVNLERGTGNNFESLQLQLNSKPKIEIKRQGKDTHISKTSSSQSIQKSENLDFSQLLEDFNKSLSQVIEVNQQLKETLKKSNDMLSPKTRNSQKIATKRNIPQDETCDYISEKYHQHNRNKNFKTIPASSIHSKTDEYTSDFEESPSSIECIENIKSNTNTNATPTILDIPQSKIITEMGRKNSQSISSNRKITKKCDQNVDNSQVEEISINQSQITNTTQEFLDSIEESSRLKTSTNLEHITESTDKNKEIVENFIIEEEISVQKNNQSLNQFSKDSLDHIEDHSVLESKNEFIKNHINNSRGDFNVKEQNDDLKSNATTTQPIESNTGPPPAYIMSEIIPTKEETTNSSICSEFFAIFNRSDVALSIYSQNESNISETTLNYSSIGMYEQLLQTETNKSDQLAALLKMREKALMDRTKGQIAWLEVQKEKYKSKGLSAQISHIKKKQRAILMKMEKEREEIKKLIQNQQQPEVSARSIISNRQQQKIRSYRPKLAENISDISIRKNFSKNSNRNNTTTTNTTNKSSNKIVRGIEIKSSPNLEIILQKREEELRKRRAHVECLMEWHQRLDKEEEEVFQLERILFEHNAVPQKQVEEKSKHHSQLQSQNKCVKELKQEKKIFEINKSLRELQNISSRSTADSTGNQNSDYVRTTGYKLNKLWRRLTGVKHIEKFEINKKYKLYKNDLEKLYEEAKEEVLREFGHQHEIMELFEQSKCLETTASSLDNQSQIIVPRLNLNFSSGQSDIEPTNCSSVFYESTIQKQFQSTDFLENIAEYSITKITNLTNEILSSEINHKSEPVRKPDSKISENIEQIEMIYLKKGENETIENSKNDEITSEYPIELYPVKTNTAEKNNSLIENNSSNSKIQITKFTDISDITENKTSNDITSLSLEEQNKSFENSKSVVIDSNSSENLKVNLSTEIISTSSKEIQSNENSDQNQIVDEILEDIKYLSENIDISNKNAERVSVIISPILTKETHNVNIIKTSDTQINAGTNREILTELESSIQPLLLSPIEEIVIFSTETNSDISKITETNSKSCQLILESSNLKKTDVKPDNSDTLETICTKLDSIKSNIDYSKDEKDNPIVSPEKSMNSDYFESLKQFSGSQSISNETFILSDQKLTNSPIVTVSEIETTIHKEKTDEYENDFSGSDITFLEDITAPKFELTMEDSGSVLEENLSNDEKLSSTTELEKRLIDLDVSLKDLHNTFDRALSPDKNLNTPPPLLSPPLNTLSNKSAPDDTTIKLDLDKTKYSLPPRNYITTTENATTLMPDIINEVEIRRRQQILIESEIKQLEQTVPPYVFLREIPNKPPPPYVPPAHGSPMTIIFPSEQRIKEITFRRTKELFDEILKTDKNTDKHDDINSSSTILKPKSIRDENITNIYERIILDICKECMEEYKEILTNLNPETYKNSLALFNPPNRLKCMQEFVYRHVKKLLAMEKKSNILQKNSLISIGRKKRDHVDEILIQELYEEEHKWTNFDQEEEEVKLAIVDEILNDIVKDVIGEITDMNQKKLEFLTNYTSVNLNNE